MKYVAMLMILFPTLVFAQDFRTTVFSTPNCDNKCPKTWECREGGTKGEYYCTSTINTPGPGNTPGPLGCCVLTFKDNSRQCFTVGYENQCSKWAKKKRTKKWQWSRSDYNCKDNHDVCVNTPEWLKTK